MESIKVLFIVIPCILGHILGEDTKFNQYWIYNLSVNSTKVLNIMRDFEMDSDGEIFLSKTSNIEVTEVVVAPHKLADFENILLRNDIKFKIVRNSMQQLNQRKRSSILGFRRK